MAKKLYVGVNGIARQVNNIYVGVNGVARKVIKGYIGVGGVARLFYELIAGGTTTLWSGPQGNISGGIQTVSCVNYANGYWVVGGTYYDGTNVYARIAYTNDLNGSWTFKDLWSTERSSTNGYASVNFIDYSNGYWVAAGEYEKAVSISGGTQYQNFAQIAYTNDLNSEWTLNSIWNSGYFSCGINENNTWVLVGYDITNQMWQIAYTTSPNENWSIKTLMGEAGVTIEMNDITCSSERFYIVGNVRTSSSYSVTVYSIDKNFTQTVISNSVWSGNESSLGLTIFYDSSNNVVAVGGSQGNNGNYSARIGYSTVDSEGNFGNWSYNDLWTGDGEVNSIIYDGNNWIIVGRRYSNSSYIGTIGFSSQIEGSWTLNNISDFRILNDIIYANGIYLAGGSNIIDSTNSVLVTYSNQINNLGQN